MNIARRNRPILGTNWRPLCLYWLLQSRAGGDGLASVLADNPVGGAGGLNSVGWGIADCLLDCLLTLALEVSDGSGGRLAHCSTSDRARFLCPGRARFAQSAG